MIFARSWRIHGSTIKAEGDPWAQNLKFVVFAETPEEALAQFRAQFPKAHCWSITHAGKVLLADTAPSQGRLP